MAEHGFIMDVERNTEKANGRRSIGIVTSIITDRKSLSEKDSAPLETCCDVAHAYSGHSL